MARVFICERRLPWSLGIEPWAVSFDVPARCDVVIDIPDTGSDFEVSCAPDTVGIDEPVFSVTIGDRTESFDFSYMTGRQA